MICIYHNKDLDGVASAAIFKMKYPDIKLIGYDNGEPIPELPDNEKIAILDISFPIQVMKELVEKSELVVWIDHHISARNEYLKYIKDFEDPFPGFPGKAVYVYEDKVSACELAWQWAFPGIKTPEAITLLGSYDTWRNQDKKLWNWCIMPFQYAMRAECNKPEDFPVVLLATGDRATFLMGKLQEAGQSILKYVSKANETLCQRNAFRIKFEGYAALCMNMQAGSTESFVSVAEDSDDILIAYFYDGKTWVFSLRTKRDDIDVSAIAKKYGGNGHKAAAGFKVSALPEEFWK